MATTQTHKTDDFRVARRRNREADAPAAAREPLAKELRAGVEAIATPGADRGRAALGVASMPQLQQAFGNRAIQRLVLQRQAAVQRAGAEEEEEVQTQRAPGAPVQRAGAEEEEEVQTQRAPGAPVQREGEEEEEVQTLRAVQRESEGGESEEEEVQTLRASVQRQGEEEEVQTLREPEAAVQREGEEEEEVQTLRASVQRKADGGGEDLGSQIRSRAGGGSPLEPGVQRWLEGGLGADMSGVRVHTGGEADKMARSVQSVAFTSGRDIYFRQGAFDTGSETGLQTLAHEATHVVQQASGPVAGTPQAGGVSVSDPSDRYEQAAESQAHDLVRGGTPAQTSGNQAVLRKVSSDAAGGVGESEPAIQRKLGWKDTNWGGAKFLDASSGGGGGVLFVGEAGTEVVVKPGEEMAAEAAMAAMFQNEASGRGGITLAPGLRVASPVEGGQIKSALEPLLDQVGANAPDVEGTKGKAFKKDRAAKLVGRLTEPGVVIQDLARGGEMKDVLAEVQKHTKKKLFGGRKLRKESPLRIFQDVRSIKALGQATAVDLFTGNRDRLLGYYNPENFMVTPYSVTMIDNIWMGTEASYFQTTEVEGRGGKKFTITADEGMSKWKSDAEVKALAAGNYDAISTLVFTKISANAAASTRDVDAEAFKKIMNKNKATFIKTFSEGLAAGKVSLVQSINRILNDPQKLRKIVPGVDLREIMDTMKKRRDFLLGGG